MTLRSTTYLGAGLAALGALACFAAEPPAIQETISFNGHIRPILSDKCFACHGPDANKRKAELRLDQPPQAGVAQKAIAAGDPGASALVKRILSADPEEQMPPPDQEKQLTPEQKDLLFAWVAQGAPYEAHWSHIPLPPNPASTPESPGATANPIDAFILRKLDREGVAAAGEADKITLARRLHWDLLGIPPTPQAVQTFVESTDPGAYDALVDSLLASPHFGERMAMDWLDVVRYADSNGYHSDEFRSVSAYRDYVINAFNQNMPFDQFTREQLAGDLLPHATREQKVASGYNRLNQITAEGGAQAKEYLAKYAADRVRTTSTAWLGTTMACAECHDHKFDPFTTREFYQFEAFFADVEEQGVYGSGGIWEPRMYLPTPEEEAREAAFAAEIQTLQTTLATDTPELQAARKAWEAALSGQREGSVQPWVRPAPASITAQGETTFLAMPDKRILASGPERETDEYTIQLPGQAGPVSAIMLEVLDDILLGGVSRGGGNFLLTNVTASWRGPGQAESTPVSFASAAADYEQEGFPVSNVLDADVKSGWSADSHLKRGNHAIVLRLAQPIALEKDGVLEVRLYFNSSFAGHQVDSFRLGWTAEPVAARTPWPALPAAVRTALSTDLPARTAEYQQALAKYFLATTPALDGERGALAKAEGGLTALRGAMLTTLISQARPEPRTIRVLARGNWQDETGEIVEPATPASLPALGVTDRRANRLDLANWLVRRDNPLTARVTMNRLWKRFYGTGISKILNDVGAQGEWPSHPELLDWLAVEFMDSGWDLKHMVRLMVTSAAYRRTSEAPPELRGRDPYNRLLARQSRYRVEAELVRDGALALSGLLTETVGGRSVFPYQPEGYYANCNTFGGVLAYETEKDANQYRRGLYSFWKRTFLHPSLLAFDAPSREECTAERPISNTPLQALVLLNDPTYVEAARAFAQRIMAEGGEQSDDRIALAFAYALSRAPRPEEMALLRDLYHEHLMEYTNDPASAEALLKIGNTPVPEGQNPVDLAAWTSVARVILNLHETITRS